MEPRVESRDAEGGFCQGKFFADVGIFFQVSERADNRLRPEVD